MDGRKMMVGLAAAAVVAVLLAGCGGTPPSTPGDKAAGAQQAKLPDGLMLSSAPAQAASVVEAMKNAKAGEAIVIRGRIGGSHRPFVDDRAVFTIVDEVLLSCDAREGDACPEPWDYCCEPKDKLAAHTATIKVTDAAGKTLKLSLQGLAGLNSLSTLVVQGKVDERPSPNALTVIATGIFVEKAAKAKAQ
jgi:hypothetical protein